MFESLASRRLLVGVAILLLALGAAGAWYGTRPRPHPESRVVPAGPPIVDPKSGTALEPLKDAKTGKADGYGVRLGKDAKGVIALPGGGTVEYKPAEKTPPPPKE